MTIERDDKNLVFKKLEDMIIPPSGLINHIKDNWWCVDEERGLIYWKTGKHLSPQCNSNESIARSFQERSYPWAIVKFIPSVFARIDPHDYVC